MTLGDIDIGSRTVWMEARGEPFEGKKAVAHVIQNRVTYSSNDRWTCVAQVCLDWLQFSGWRDNDPSFKKAQEIGYSDPVFLECLHAFIEASREPDNTKGARHYHSKLIKPSWAVGQTPCVEIGNHVFYNTVR